MSIADGRHTNKRAPRRLTDEEAKGTTGGGHGFNSGHHTGGGGGRAQARAAARRRASALAAGESSVAVADADDAHADAQRALTTTPPLGEDDGVTAFALGHELDGLLISETAAEGLANAPPWY